MLDVIGLCWGDEVPVGRGGLGSVGLGEGSTTDDAAGVSGEDPGLKGDVGADIGDAALGRDAGLRGDWSTGTVL